MLFTAVLSAVLSGKTEGEREGEKEEGGQGQQGAEPYPDCLCSSFAKSDWKERSTPSSLQLKYSRSIKTVINLNVD